MTSLKIWFQGARPKTLGAAIAPVLVGSSIAYYEKSFDLTISLLALMVSISIQIAVNYANDYLRCFKICTLFINTNCW